MRGLAVNGPTLRAARMARGLTQEALAHQANCDVKTIRNAERGLRVDAATVKKIADVLRQPLSTIIASENGSQQLAVKNVELFWTWQDASNDRDVDRMLACYHPEATVLIAGADGLPGGGTFHGLDEIRGQWMAAQDALETETLTPDDLRVDAVGDYVFVRGWATATVRVTGQEFTSLGVHEFLMEGNKILQHTLVVDTAAVRRCLDGGA